MLKKIKNALYFLVAHYFSFWAKIQLYLWHPRIVVVTGSNGKTTTLHLIESQLQHAARYSHHANSTYGIPFDILGLHRKTYHKTEWIIFFLLAPINAWKTPPKEKIYVVEADAERPGEGKFLSRLLNPEVTIWLSCARTHSQQFEKSVRQGKFVTVDDAIAYEFGYFLERTSKMVLVDDTNPLIHGQKNRVSAKWERMQNQDDSESYVLTTTGTTFLLQKDTIKLPYLLPQETGVAISAIKILTRYFNSPVDASFSQLVLPPGRSSLFAGIKNTTLIDSSYNANLASTAAMISMVEKISSPKKWAILGDLIEQGNQEQEEHEKLAEILASCHCERIILVGPRLAKYTLPILQHLPENTISVVSFIETKDARDYILSAISGNELILFKGARFLEGIIEPLLAHPEDRKRLCRQEKIWKDRRKKWSL